MSDSWKQTTLGGTEVKLGDVIAVVYHAVASKSVPRTNINVKDEILVCRNAIAKRIIDLSAAENSDENASRFLADGFDPEAKRRIRRFNLDRISVFIPSEIESDTVKQMEKLKGLAGTDNVYICIFAGCTDDGKGIFVLKAFSSDDTIA